MRLRPASTADDEFCFQLHQASMREYVEPIWGWDADVQRKAHAKWFKPDQLSIIEDDDGKAIGVLDVRDEGDHLYLSRIEILPGHQGLGVGASVIHDLLGKGRPIRLDILPNNVRARRFYERLGFTVDRRPQREGRLSMHSDEAHEVPQSRTDVSRTELP